MIDVKKLIIGFLILATSASSTALIFSSISGSSSAANKQIPGTSQLATVSQSLPLGSNAFAPTQNTYADNFAEASSSAGPITNSFTDVILNGFLAANPNGPQEDASGSTSFVAPDANAMLASLSANSSLQNFTIPNWDIEAAGQPLHVLATSSPEAVAQYTNSLSKTLSYYFDAADIKDAVDPQSPDPSKLAYVGTQIGQALDNIVALQVPSQLVNFQKRLITVLVYEKNALALAQNPGDDPIKTGLIFQAEQDKYQLAVNAFSSEVQKAQSQNLFSFDADNAGSKNGDGGLLAKLQSVIGIPVAHAQFGFGIVSDPITEAETTLTVAQMIWQFAQGIILQILKNTIINQFQNRILKWVQGNGIPRFVQLWGRTLVNSFNAAANGAIAQASQGLYPAFQAPVRSSLSQFYNPLGTALTTPLENTVGNNLQGFYGNFSQGGWPAYAASILPTGNYYGSTFFTAQTVGQIAQTQKTAAQSQAIAGQGTTAGNDLACADGSNPLTGTHLVCLDQNDVPVYPNPNGTCDPGYFPSQAPNAGSCANGAEPVKTSPDIATAQGLDSSIGSPVHLVVNANNPVDLLISYAQSFITSLTQKAITAGTNALNGGLAGTGAGAAPPTVAPPTPLSCSVAVSPVTLTNGQAIAYFTANGGAATNGIPPTYLWAAPGGTLSATAGFGISVTYPAAGNYTATVTASTGGNANCAVTVN